MIGWLSRLFPPRCAHDWQQIGRGELHTKIDGEWQHTGFFSRLECAKCHRVRIDRRKV